MPSESLHSVVKKSVNIVCPIDPTEPQGIIKIPCNINGNYVKIKKNEGVAYSALLNHRLRAYKAHTVKSGDINDEEDVLGNGVVGSMRYYQLRTI